MTFPNAYQGVKKIFSAEILSLIGSICMIIFAIFGIIAVAGMENNSDDAAVAGGIGAVVFGLAGGILLLIGLIFMLVGTKRAGKDETMFNQAFIFVLCSLILTVASTVIATIWSTGIWDNLSTTVANVFTMIATIYIVNGIQNLARKLNNEAMVSKGKTYMILLLIAYVIQIIVRVIPVFFGADAAKTNGAVILTLVAEIFSLIVYILYLVYLGSAKKMLKAN